MAKLGDFKTPTGASGSIFNIGDLLSLVLGGVVLIFTFAAAQNITKKVGNKVPGLDGNVDLPAVHTIVSNPSQQKARQVL